MILHFRCCSEFSFYETRPENRDPSYKGSLHGDLELLELAFSIASGVFYMRLFPNMSAKDQRRCNERWPIFFEAERRRKAEEYRKSLEGNNATVSA
jgi:hypothetical protein